MTLEEEIRELLPQARAVSKGSMDPIFDAFWDGDAWLKGERTILKGDGTRDGAGREIRDSLRGFIEARAAKR